MENPDQNDTFDDAEKDLAACGLKQLGTSADGTNLVYLCMDLHNQNLTDVESVSKYQHIQRLNLSNNDLTDLNSLSFLHHLLYLDVSCNYLTKILDFEPPFGIIEANFSNNLIQEMNNLSSHEMLRTLKLDFNGIKEIIGLQDCHQLNELSLSHNCINKISGLDGLSIKKLNLSHNYLYNIENIESLHHLQDLNLSSNAISSLSGLKDLHLLHKLQMQHNQIAKICEVEHLKDLQMLRLLHLNENSIQEVPNYRVSTIYKMQKLTELDFVSVTPEEKVSAINLFAPNGKLTAACYHSYNLIQSYFNRVVLLESSLPSGQQYPIMIIVGVEEDQNNLLADKLCKEYPRKFKMIMTHTTKVDIVTTETTSQYVHVIEEDFESMNEKGNFLQSCYVEGHYYGVSHDAIEAVAQKKLIGVISMDLEGVYGFKGLPFESKYLFLLPECKLKFEDLLISEGYSAEQICNSLNRIERLKNMHQEHPGYFDAVIATDNIEEKYLNLKNTVLDYLNDTVFQVSGNRGKVLPADLETDKRSQKVRLEFGYQTTEFSRRYDRTKTAIQGITSLPISPSGCTIIPQVYGCSDLMLLAQETSDDGSNFTMVSNI